MYGPTFFEGLTTILKKVAPRFKKQVFLNQIFDRQWQDMELKQRIRHIASVLHRHLPGNYEEQLEYILRIVEEAKESGVKESFPYMFLPDFIEQYGLEHPQTSLQAMETLTQFVSCEFAIRPFLLQDTPTVMTRMLEWSFHSHPHVRRFSSEGCRPRLPWAMAVPQLKKDPSLIILILENLKNDPSLFVRKSVANNLNDIAKDHPRVVTELAKSWKGQSPETDWIIRHGCRGLLKKADREAYALFGLNGKEACEISGLKLDKKKLRVGDRLNFSFELKTTAKKPCRLRLEYAVYYVKANGKQSRKIFQLAEKNYSPGVHRFEKQQGFRDLTTRRHHAGKHKIGIVVNGVEMASRDFMLEE